jgi:hypothetical protein
MKQKLKFGKPLKIVITTFAIFVFTILAHHFSVEPVANNFIDAMGTFKLTQELPSVLAQTPTQTPTPTPTPTRPANSTPTPPLTKTPIKESTILWLLIVVLMGVLALLFTILSPVVGSLDKSTLKEKAIFLTETFPKILEGVTVVLIVMVITVLTLAGYLGQEGALSIFSALIGYVLGRKASELEFQTPPSQKNKNPTSLSITPEQPQVKFGDELKIKIDPAQEVDSTIDIQPPGTGSVKVQDKSTLIYTAPSQGNLTNATTVTITVRSKVSSIQPASANITVV